MEEAKIHVLSWEESKTPGVGMEYKLEEAEKERNYCYTEIQIAKDDWDMILRESTNRPTMADNCGEMSRYWLTGELLGDDGPIDALASLESSLRGRLC